ncbi:DUF6378 domain-containing protein [Candidatus Halocynthiibacter alkanivorans]|uniref:DUF6378 domain-containing protein n=1 Tax=Candidatus Halocynthiibacter alkanivorans TaxID=2267619 RepID=UPI00109C163B|nr:DUF6378 domain-containing protein [Candidatus Halocynthiibacter alkanivorans]
MQNPIAYKLLTDAADAINGERAGDYGPAIRNFEKIAGLWTALRPETPEGFKVKFEPSDVATMLMCVKLARLQNTPDHEDSWKDIAGYAALGHEVSYDDGDGGEELTDQEKDVVGGHPDHWLQIAKSVTHSELIGRVTDFVNRSKDCCDYVDACTKGIGFANVLDMGGVDDIARLWLQLELYDVVGPERAAVLREALDNEMKKFFDDYAADPTVTHRRLPYRPRPTPPAGCVTEGDEDSDQEYVLERLPYRRHATLQRRNPVDNVSPERLPYRWPAPEQAQKG